jgi:peptide methionine sulfoxide reductase msrA/msrB
MSFKICLTIFIAALFIMGGNLMADTKLEKAVFAGGCFWCMEGPFEALPGVKEVIAGYTGGTKVNPTYEEVSSGASGHVEAIQVTFDPAQISYEKILDVYWRQIDPTDEGGQFVDRGSQYQTGIFYTSEEQKKIAEASKEKLGRSGVFNKPIVTKIRKAETFYKAEDYHQDYYKNSPIRYKLYKANSGRIPFLDKTWKAFDKDKTEVAVTSTPSKPSKEELLRKLTPMQYNITQKCGTEPAFQNEYWNNKKEGIYVDIVSGEVLFSSTDKFESGTGWPSFTRPVEEGNVVQKPDKTLGMVRTEVRSKLGDSHLGHLFDDGPTPTGQRYCINSGALRFIPKENLEKEGYGKYKRLFDGK